MGIGYIPVLILRYITEQIFPAHILAQISHLISVVIYFGKGGN